MNRGVVREAWQEHETIPCAVVGSGLFGIMAVRELTRRGLDVDWYSADSEPGGIWQGFPHGKARGSTELVNPGWCISRRFWRIRPVGAAEFLDELVRWADERRDKQFRYFGSSVNMVEESSEGVLVTSDRGAKRYLFLVVATGHYGKPMIPFPYSGKRVVHASILPDLSSVGVGDRVLVVGGGQSGVEICEELLATLPMIRPTWVTSRKVLLISRLSFLGIVGTCLSYRTAEEAPRGFVITKDSGRVRSRCDIRPVRVERVEEETVYFSDGTTGCFEHVIAATGYLPPEKLAFPASVRGKSKGMRVSIGGHIVSLNHFGDGCAGASVRCARRQAREVGRLVTEVLAQHRLTGSP